MLKQKYEKCILIDSEYTKQQIDLVVNDFEDVLYLFFSDNAKVEEYIRSKAVSFLCIDIPYDIQQYKKNIFLRVSFACAIAEYYQSEMLLLVCDSRKFFCDTKVVDDYIKKIAKVIFYGTKSRICFQYMNMLAEKRVKDFTNSPDLRTGSNKVLVLYSGGLDCSVAYKLSTLFAKDISLLFFDYGQRNVVEEESSCKRILREEKRKNLHFIKINLYSFFETISNKCGLLSREINLTVENKELEYVPFRNTIFISIALCMCQADNINMIVTGSQNDDAISPDNSSLYYDALNELISMQYGTKEIYLNPILKKIGGKKETIQLGDALGVDFENTWTCHKESQDSQRRIQCGECVDCRARYAAFKELGLEDPVSYKIIPRNI